MKLHMAARSRFSTFTVIDSEYRARYFGSPLKDQRTLPFRLSGNFLPEGARALVWQLGKVA